MRIRPRPTSQEILAWARGIRDTANDARSVKVPVALIVLAADDLLRVGGPQQWDALMRAFGYKVNR